MLRADPVRLAPTNGSLARDHRPYEGSTRRRY